MKKLKKLVSTIMVTALCVLLPNINAMTVAAQEPVTYYVKYLESPNPLPLLKNPPVCPTGF